MRPSSVPLILIMALCLAFGLSASRVNALEVQKSVWTPTWFTSMVPDSKGATLSQTTFRTVMRATVGGKAVRIRVSNLYGSVPVRLQDLSIARRLIGSEIDPATHTKLTFDSQGAVILAPGETRLSDAVAFEVASGQDLAISFYVEDETPQTTVHWTRRNRVYSTPGNRTAAPRFEATTTDEKGPVVWLNALLVENPKASGAIVAFGDSITDGAGLVTDGYTNWPARLAKRLSDLGLSDIGVVNAGISGNRLLHNGMGERQGEQGQTRFMRDVIGQSNLSSVIILIGINDIGQVQSGRDAKDFVTPQQIELGLAKLSLAAKDKGLCVFVGTLTPFRDTKIKNYFSEDKELARLHVNQWLRETSLFDGIIDFERAIADPKAPDRVLADYDSGDHLHPSADGNQAMANAIPIAALKHCAKKKN